MHFWSKKEFLMVHFKIDCEQSEQLVHIGIIPQILGTRGNVIIMQIMLFCLLAHQKV